MAGVIFTDRVAEVLFDPSTGRFIAVRAVDETGRQIMLYTAGITIEQPPVRDGRGALIIRIPEGAYRVVVVDSSEGVVDTLAQEKTAVAFGRGKVEIVTGTTRGVGGPHPPVEHADEVELMRPEVWEAGREA